MYLDIEHNLWLTYDDYISESWVELRMEPQSNHRQTVNSYFLAVGPQTKVSRYQDWLGNAVRHFSVAEFHNQIEVRSRSVVETKPNSIPLGRVRERQLPKAGLGPILDFLEFGGPIPKSAALKELFKSANLDRELPLGERVERLGRFVHETFEYRPMVTFYHSSIDEALTHRAGVCQDLAQILIGLLRLAHIPARYVNGYLHVDREGKAASESHAWAEFYSREHGWVGFDPTGNVQPDERHVVVAYGRHYDEVPPNRGIYRGAAQETLRAEVRTKPIPAPAVSTFREEIREIRLPV